MTKPDTKPNNPCFSSGPCAKRPGWSPEKLNTTHAGRSHRASGAKTALKKIIETHRTLLKIPADYYIGIVPASDTGAFEMAMWHMLGERGVDVMAWEAFSGDWLKDITNELKLDDARTFEADYGQLPDLNQIDTDRDVVFVWNGTTAGVRLPNADWIKDERKGLTLCDATSAVFAYDMPWEKLDVTTWSWQKVLGSEAAHGMIVLSPRAVERLETYKPDRPLPKIFRMTKNGKLNTGIFEGSTINTPSMLAVADCQDALDWVESIGGLQETIARSTRNYEAIEQWVNTSDWAKFLCEDEQTRSRTSVCLTIKDSWFQNLPDTDQSAIIGDMCKTLDAENVAYDIKAYRTAPAGFRIWCGATVEESNVKAVLPWLDWAFTQQKSKADPENQKIAV